MRLLTLNMNMFNYQNDNSFYKYLQDIKPELAIIQEARFNRLDREKHNIIFPKGYDNGNIDSRIRLTVAFYKEAWERDDNFDFGEYNYSHISLKKNKWLVLGVHTPEIKKDDIDIFKNLYVADIVCGDLNASSKNKESLHFKLYENLIKNGYCDLWKKSISNKKAYYYNYRGEKLSADKDVFYRTYSGNTHIDYVLGRPNLEINEIIIDYRTLAFTDHTGIIIDVEETKCDSSF